GNDITLTFTSTLTAEEQAALTAAGFSSVTSTSAVFASGASVTNLASVTMFVDLGDSVAVDETITVTGFSFDGQAATANGAGVVVYAGQPTEATISVSANTLASAVTGNEAVNTLMAEATTLGTVQSDSSYAYFVSGTPSIAAANADHVLVSEQAATDLTATSTVYGTFAVDINDNDGSSGSTVVVDGNTIEAAATANSVTNAVDLTATNATTTAALANAQDNFTDVITTADMMVYTNAASDDSTVSMSDNVNQSLATGNSASNSVVMAATNIESVSGVDANNVDTQNADLSLISYQQSNFGGVTGSGVSAVADTTIFNGDLVDSDVGSINASTFAMDGNVTVAQATTNTVANTVVVGSADTANNDATAFLGNFQSSAGETTATSTASQELTMESTSDTILNSTVSVDGNITTARATANSSINQMSVAGANITAGDGVDAYADVDLADLSAAYVVLNNQSASNIVTASASATNAVDLTSDDNALDGSTVSLNGNVVQAYATANMASNSVLNVGGSATASLDATGLLYNDQQSTGPAVEATVTSIVTATADAVDSVTADCGIERQLAVRSSLTVMSRLRWHGSNVANNSMSVSAVNATVETAAMPRSTTTRML
ncbi:MAG: hypothetical protein R3D81_14630, partial [Thalassovita sp.]